MTLSNTECGTKRGHILHSVAQNQCHRNKFLRETSQVTYVWRNNVARSCNHCCSGRSHDHYKNSVCICSLRYPACNAHAPYCHLWPTPLYIFFTFSHKQHDFRKKKKLLNIKCMFRVSVQLLYDTFFILRRTERDMIENILVYWSSYEVKVKVKFIPQQAEVGQRVPGRLRARIFLTFGTTRVVSRQPYAPAAFTPGVIPGTHFQELSRPHPSGGATKKIPSNTTGNRPRDRPTSSAVP